MKRAKEPLIKKYPNGIAEAGFLDKKTNVFTKVMDIKDNEDLDDFMNNYNLSIVVCNLIK